ncbi:MAG: azurin [Opitutaceae bacterium]
MKTATIVTLLLVLGAAGAFVVGCGKSESPSDSGAQVAEPAGAPDPANARAIEITGNDTMKFSLTEIHAKAGETLTVTLMNVGTMPKLSMGHNWILLKNTAAVEPLIADAPQAATTDYIPASHSGDILAHTKLLGPGEKDSVTFRVPSKRGRYPFICSFPGHYQVGMKGELIVE